MLKKRIKLLIFISCIFFITGCSSNNSLQNNEMDDNTIKKNSGRLECIQEVNAEAGLDVSIKYNIKYRNGNILNLESITKVSGEDQAKIDVYENAYRNIANNYKGLKYYDTNILRDNNSVTYKSNINYDKIDIDKIIEIEGEEDNIFEKDKAKLNLWLELSKKVGVSCKEV